MSWSASMYDAMLDEPSDDESRGRSGRWVLGVGVAALVLVVSLGVAMARGVGQTPTGLGNAPFDVAPEVDLPTFDGGRIRLSDHTEGPVFVYFWASWCAPCREEAPIIEQLWPEYRERGYTFVGINIQDPEVDARRFTEQVPVTFPLARDTGKVYLEFGVYGVPESFFFAPNLEPRGRLFGPVSAARLRGVLDSLGAAQP